MEYNSFLAPRRDGGKCRSDSAVRGSLVRLTCKGPVAFNAGESVLLFTSHVGESLAVPGARERWSFCAYVFWGELPPWVGESVSELLYRSYRDAGTGKSV